MSLRRVDELKNATAETTLAAQDSLFIAIESRSSTLVTAAGFFFYFQILIGYNRVLFQH